MTHKELVSQVRRRLRDKGITTYELHQRLQAKVSKQTVYNFVIHGKVIKSNILVAILSELGLAVTWHRRGKRS